MSTVPDAEFKAALLAVVPGLRAFARALTGRQDQADDLVQDTLLRAWAARDQFQANTSIQAWTFRILRNRQYTLWRRAKRWVEMDTASEESLVADAGQHAALELAELYNALRKLSPQHREALILVGAGGVSQEEAALICNCAVGTIKSRVARAREALARQLSLRESDDLSEHRISSTQVMDQLSDDVARHRKG